MCYMFVHLPLRTTLSQPSCNTSHPWLLQRFKKQREDTGHALNIGAKADAQLVSKDDTHDFTAHQASSDDPPDMDLLNTRTNNASSLGSTARYSGVCLRCRSGDRVHSRLCTARHATDMSLTPFFCAQPVMKILRRASSACLGCLPFFRLTCRCWTTIS